MKTIHDAITKIRDEYKLGTKERLSWDTWYSSFVPTIDNVDLYVKHVLDQKKHVYTKICKSPFRILFQKNKARTENPWPKMHKFTDLFNLTFEWPKILQAAMNSVFYSLNKNPPAPRMGVETDAKLLENINSFTTETNLHSIKLSR